MQVKINFTGMKSLPMYGQSVEALYLDIDGKQYVVTAGPDGNPVLKLQATGHYNPATGALEEA
jgi:hypothetical protein